MTTAVPSSAAEVDEEVESRESCQIHHKNVSLQSMWINKQTHLNHTHNVGKLGIRWFSILTRFLPINQKTMTKSSLYYLLMKVC